jgi:hypothetical protein
VRTCHLPQQLTPKTLHDENIDDTTPVHVAKQQSNDNGLYKVDYFYVGNIGTHIRAKEIASYLQRRNVTVYSVDILPTRNYEHNGAKLTIKHGCRQDILGKQFFPGKGVYARPWYPATERKRL